MIYGSVCTGIGAPENAWKVLGWRAAFMSEIAAFPRAVLKFHHPEIPLHGDFTTIQAGDYEPIDLLVGGTPCQSFSIAGLRGGLDDDRGNLSLEYLRLADRLRPRWLVWENVPGVLSSNDGRDFGAILGGMVELGYGFAYRVLDAQHVRTRFWPRAVPQRRRRVFVVGYLGDWRPPAAVLFERESLLGNPPPRREAGQGIAPALASGSEGGGGAGDDLDQHVAHALRGEGFDASEDGTGRGTPLGPVAFGGNDTRGPIAVSTAINAHGGPMGRLDFESETFIAHAIQAGALRENPSSGPDGMGVGEGVAFTLEARAEVQAVSFAVRGREEGAVPEVEGDGDAASALRAASGGSSRDYIAFTAKDHGADAGEISPTQRGGGHDRSHANGGVMPAVAFTASDQANSFAWERDHYPTLSAQVPNDSSNIQIGVRTDAGVRRLTPKECSRLMALPDDFAQIPWRGKNAAPDGPMYKAYGNSMAGNVIGFVGERIDIVERLINPKGTR